MENLFLTIKKSIFFFCPINKLSGRGRGGGLPKALLLSYCIMFKFLLKFSLKVPRLVSFLTEFALRGKQNTLFSVQEYLA